MGHHVLHSVVKELYIHIFVFSLLVNIYGSCEMFVSEYRNLLADRLLQMCSYDVSREVSGSITNDSTVAMCTCTYFECVLQIQTAVCNQWPGHLFFTPHLGETTCHL